ncbi:adhesion regulating molecule [Laetiporus sulphureus 93-53]|uniref:Adhesion regulating molecule n=1 Tax=Laetiporus sulphureus 93-53 TaxID=1314785 RepID=A0A165HSB9_9APHY|nr:adhesion regulating molecule [Laetiporus sulphureus 93-53]KZT12121.1 adhesion regulating molecule [Laetiporus sulphureus 93-53]
MTEPRIAFKAGRCFRREGTNFVDVDPTKGAIILQNGEDGLLHFIWKNRSTNTVEEDLILFPMDATFVKVEQSAWGRTYVLKFSSSNQRHFFWMQDADPSRDVEFVSNVNRLLTDPQTVPIWFAPGYNPGEDAQVSSSSAPTVATPAEADLSQAGPSSQSSGSSNPYNATPEQLAQMQQILASLATPGTQTMEPELSLTDILTPANLMPLFHSHPELVQSLYPHLPPDLPSPPSEEALHRIISSPQFRAALRNFDQALRTGLLGGLVRGLGLPEEAGTGIQAFLRAIKEQAQSQSGGGDDTDRMDTAE